MSTLHKYDLNLDKSMVFFKESLEETNSLSVEIMKLISSEGGRFFTLLPQEAKVEKVNQFTEAILPAAPKQRGGLGHLPGIHTYSEVFTIDKDISYYLAQDIRRRNSNCIIDHYNACYKKECRAELFCKYGVHKDEEIYYLLEPSVSQEGILLCLRASRTFWHSLCVLIEPSPQLHSNKILSQDMIYEISQKTYLVMIGAYDGEGYIFWERTN